MTAETHVLDLLPAYALGALDEGETLLVTKHLGECATCRAELATYQPVLAHLPLAVAEQTPTPQVKTRLFKHLPGVTPPPQDKKPAWLEGITQPFRAASPAWLAFSLVAILLLAVSNAWLWLRLNQSEANAEFRTVMIAGTANASHATGLLVIGHDGNLGTLVVDELPVLDSAHQYQLWLIKDGQRTSGGVFSTDEFGYGALAISAPDPLNSYEAIGITIEPAGGSPGPTGEKVMGGDL